MTALLTLIFKVTAKVRVNLLGLWLACTGGGSCYLLDKYFFFFCVSFPFFLFGCVHAFFYLNGE